MKTFSKFIIVGFICSVMLFCQKPVDSDQATKPIMFFSLTSDPLVDAHSMTMAFQLANHALEDGRTVVLFFNVKAVTVPTKDFDENIAFHAQPIKQLLADLITKGAHVHVYPHCMEAIGVKTDDLITGAKVTTRSELFSFITNQTVVFTY